MKIKLPLNATACESNSVVGRSIIKMDGLCGWDIAAALAKLNNTHVVGIGASVDMLVCNDHVMVDSIALS